MKTVFPRALVPLAGALMLLSCASLGASGSRQTWRPPRPVAISKGAHHIICVNLFPSLWLSYSSMTYAAGGGTGGLLVREGDIIFAGAFDSGTIHGLVYTHSDGSSLEVREEDGRLILSGKTVSIAPDGFAGCWEWLDRASSDDLRSLRFLMLPEELEEMDESRRQILRKVAAVNPDLSLFIRSLSGWKSAAALFKPRMLILGGSATDISGFLADQKQIETLCIWGILGEELSGIDVDNLDFLAKLPHLRRLTIFGWDPATTGPLPKGMRALKSLMLVRTSDSVPLDASALEAVPRGIEELSLVGYEMTNLSCLERFSDLRTLILYVGGEIEDLAALRGMKRLARVGLPPHITQEQFSAFIGEHPTIQIVELMEYSEITDLSPLQRLTGLTGLAAKEFHGELEAVYRLKSLEFLALPGYAFNHDTKSLDRIREELPRALVVVPACLGSGWILLVIPLAALMWIAGSRMRRRRRASPYGADT
jgi:hypothetical protein